MPFVQRVIEPKYLSRTSLFDEDGNAKVGDEELQAVTNNTLSNALRQLASLVLVADDIFKELSGQLQAINKRSDTLKVKINVLEEKVADYDPKKVTVPEGDISSFALLKTHFCTKNVFETNLFSAETRPNALKELYESATKTPVHLMRQLDRWRRDGHRSSRFFLCTPVLGAKRRKIRNRIDIDIETRMPAAVEELRRWTSDEALGDVTVNPDCLNRIAPFYTLTDGDFTDGTIGSDDEAIDHKLPSPEEQLQVVALKFPAEVVRVDISGKSFDRMSIQRRSLMHGEVSSRTEGGAGGEATIRRRTRSRRPRNKRRNTLAGTDQKEIVDALTAGDETSSPTFSHEPESVARSKSSDLLRSKKESPDKKSSTSSHFNTLKQWSKNRYDRFMNKSAESAKSPSDDIDDFNVYETITMKRKRDLEKERRTHERNSSISSSEKSSINLPVSTLSSVMNIAVKLRESSAQRRQKRLGANKDEQPHSSSGNWSASSESGRASIGSEITTSTATHPKSTSAATSSNSLNHLQPPSSVNSRRRFNLNSSASGSVTSEGTLTPDIIHDLHEDETSSIYSCDAEGYYTSFHMDSGLKTLKEEDLPPTPIHSTSVFTNSGNSNVTVLSAENEYELFGKGSTSTTTSSAGTVCTTLRASESNRSLIIGPAVPERKSSLLNKSPESSLERDFSSDKTGTVKRSPATNKPTVVAIIHKDGDVSPDSGHNTSSSPIESINSPNGVRSGSEFEFSENSDMEGAAERTTERIRVKTTINSSRIPSMCVITPPHSDDESVKSSNSYFKQVTEQNKMNYLGVDNSNRGKLELPLVNIHHTNNESELKSTDSDKENCNSIHQQMISVNGSNKLLNVNPQSGYVTVEQMEEHKNELASKPTSPKPSSMFGRLKNNIVNFAERKLSKSPSRTEENSLENYEIDAGEYVTIADVRNNNEKSPESFYANDMVNKNLKTVLSGKDAEYVSLNELPHNNNNVTTIDSLERKKRQGARVTLDAEGKVVYSSDSLPRNKKAHSTFEPGPFVKPPSNQEDLDSTSPQNVHRTPKLIRPVNNTQNQRVANVLSTEFNRPLSPKPTGKIVIKAAATGQLTSPTTEIVRMAPSTIVASSRPMSPSKTTATSRGAYVHVQDSGRPLSPQQALTTLKDKDRVVSAKSLSEQNYLHKGVQDLPAFNPSEMYYPNENPPYYVQKPITAYNTLPSKKSQYFQTDANPERSVTPDITRGLSRKFDPNVGFTNYDSSFRHYQPTKPTDFYEPKNDIYERNQMLTRNMAAPSQVANRSINHTYHTLYNTNNPPNQKMGIPVQMPQIYSPITPHHRNFEDQTDSFLISPIDPRNSYGFQSSTPASKDLKAASNLDKLLSPKKSTMSNDELYAIIHKSKKKMNIETEADVLKKVMDTEAEAKKQVIKSPETGYFGDKTKSRLSWSPNKGDYVDFNADIDKLSPPNGSRSRQSWACSDRKGNQQTSRLDFKRLLLQKSNFPGMKSKKLSAVEQLKLTKQQPPSNSKPDMSILDLSGSPRSLVNRKFSNNPPGSPKNTPEKVKATPKILSPKSQWRFASPRSDVLSSTILEDCREDEVSPNNSAEKNMKACSSSSRNIFAGHTFGKDIKSTNNVDEKQKQSYTSLSQKLQAQRAQFFNSRSIADDNSQLNKNGTESETISAGAHPRTLETSF